MVENIKTPGATPPGHDWVGSMSTGTHSLLWGFFAKRREIMSSAITSISERVFILVISRRKGCGFSQAQTLLQRCCEGGPGTKSRPSTADWQPLGIFSLVHPLRNFDTLFQLAEISRDWFVEMLNVLTVTYTIIGCRQDELSFGFYRRK